MDQATISITISIIAVVFTAITFFTNRTSSSSKDGERWGSLQKELEYMRNDLKEIKNLTRNNEAQVNASMDEMRKWTKENISHLHSRLDDHLRKEHDMTVPNRNP